MRGRVAAGIIALIGPLSACGGQNGTGAGGGEQGGGGSASDGGVSLAGTVTADDVPVAGAGVLLYRIDGDGRIAVGKTLTSAGGRFTFPAVPLGTYSLEARGPGHIAAQVEDLAVQSDLADVALVLATRNGALYELRGQVLGDPGSGTRPLAGAAIRLEPTDGAMQPELQSAARNGSFSFRVPAGRYRLEVGASGYEDLASPAVAVSDASRDGIVMLATSRRMEGHTLTGQARDADGPLSGAAVSLSRLERGTLEAMASTETGPDGTFTFV
jgi:hypothetical protein